MTDIDRGQADAPATRRWRLGIWVAAALAVVVVAAVSLVVLLRDGGHTVRFEVTSRDGNVNQILWGTEDGIQVLRRDQPGQSSLSTPWSQTLKLEKTTGKLVLNASVTLGATDEVTCRLLMDGEVKAQRTAPAGAACDADIATILRD